MYPSHQNTYSLKILHHEIQRFAHKAVKFTFCRVETLFRKLNIAYKAGNTYAVSEFVTILLWSRIYVLVL